MANISLKREGRIQRQKNVVAAGMGPTVEFKTKRGGSFRKSFKSPSSAARAIKGWRAKGGKVNKVIRWTY